LLRFWVEGSLIVISDWVIEEANCGKFLVDFVGSAEYAKWPVGLPWPNGRRGDFGVLVLFFWFG
jgi:hypothetical protein